MLHWLAENDQRGRVLVAKHPVADPANDREQNNLGSYRDLAHFLEPSLRRNQKLLSKTHDIGLDVEGQEHGVENREELGRPELLEEILDGGVLAAFLAMVFPEEFRTLRQDDNKNNKKHQNKAKRHEAHALEVVFEQHGDHRDKNDMKEGHSYKQELRVVLMKLDLVLVRDPLLLVKTERVKQEFEKIPRHDGVNEQRGKKIDDEGPREDLDHPLGDVRS